MATFFRFSFLAIILLSLFSCSNNDEIMTISSREQIKKNFFNDNWRYNYMDKFYTNKVAFLNNKYYTQLNNYEPILFLNAYREYKLQFIRSCKYVENSIDKFDSFFYESSSSYNHYAYFFAFMAYGADGFYSEGVGSLIAEMFIMFPSKFYEMNNYTKLLNKEEQHNIWTFIAYNCSLEMLYYKKIKDTSITIYKDLYPYLYESFGSAPWKLVRVSYDENYRDDTSYIDFLWQQFERSIDKKQE